MGFISQESILEVKNAVDLVEIASGYIPLKRKGNSYWAPCPFHDEKTASFHVVPDKQFFKCFGCGAHGGVIDFVEKFEKVDFPAAISLLAERAHITLRYEGGGRPEGQGREDLLRLHDWAAATFRAQLLGPEGQVARDFLKRRGVTDETSESWKLGFSIESWDTLIKKARKAGFDEKLMMAAGLAVEREDGSGCYDRFRGRVMFPIFDVRGKVIAFGARTLKGDEQPKFINSPESLLFSKGRQLYGLHLAKEDVEETRTLYIVEGYLDVIVPWQAGVKGLVATLGTSLTRDHLKLLKRHVDRVVLVFDSDAAGQKAAERGLDMLLSEDMDLLVACLPPDQDTDDVIQKSGAQGLQDVLSKPKQVFEFLLDSLQAKTDMTTPNGKTRVVEELMKRIALVPNEVKQAFLVKEVVARFGVDERILISRLKKEAPPAPLRKVEPVATPSASKVGRELLSLFFSDEASAEQIRKALAPERYPDEVTRAVAAAAYPLYDKSGKASASDVIALLHADEPARMALVEAVDAPFDVKAAPRQLEECLRFLKNEEFKGQAAALKSHNDEDLERIMQAKKGSKDVRLFPRNR